MAVVAIAGFVGGALVAGRMAAQLDSHPRQWLGASFGTEAVLLAAVAVCTGTGLLSFTGATATSPW